MSLNEESPIKKSKHTHVTNAPILHQNIFDQLTDDLVANEIMSFLGGGKYRFVAGVNKRFRKCYQRSYPEKTTHIKDSYTFLSTGMVVLEELESERMDACSTIASVGTLDLLQWARKIGCRWDARTCAMAAKHGHFQILKWAKETGCRWQWATCEWTREDGCEWNETTCVEAANSGHFEILKWAVANGCDCNWEHVERIAEHNAHSGMLDWARENKQREEARWSIDARVRSGN